MEQAVRVPHGHWRSGLCTQFRATCVRQPHLRSISMATVVVTQSPTMVQRVTATCKTVVRHAVARFKTVVLAVISCVSTVAAVVMDSWTQLLISTALTLSVFTKYVPVAFITLRAGAAVSAGVFLFFVATFALIAAAPTIRTPLAQVVSLVGVSPNAVLPTPVPTPKSMLPFWILFCLPCVWFAVTLVLRFIAVKGSSLLD